MNNSEKGIETDIHTFGKNSLNQTTKRDESQKNLKQESKGQPKTPDTNISRKGKQLNPLKNQQNIKIVKPSTAVGNNLDQYTGDVADQYVPKMSNYT